MYAFCDRRGVIEFGPDVPRGMLDLARGEEAELRELFSAKARHAYDGKTLLVPGVPEARSDEAALEAVQAFVLWLRRREARG